MRAVFLCVAAVALAAPASANAAKLSVAGGTLTYIGDPGLRTAISFELVDPAAPTNVRVVRLSSPFYPPDNDNDPITAAGCSPDATFSPGIAFVCGGVARVVAAAGDGRDAVQVADFPGPISVSGGPGDDSLSGGAGSDALYGDEGADYVTGGAGHDVLHGGSGDDSLDGGSGSDQLRGDAGFDGAVHTTTVDRAKVAITLDGVADDGVTGEQDDFGADIEDIDAYGTFTGPGFDSPRAIPSITVVGTAEANMITTDAGDDALSGGAGNDRLNSREGNDTIDARDGYADRVGCGSGTDTVLADTFDTFSDCENVQVATVPSATEDAPPTIAWTTPAPTKALRANDVNLLEAAASDDRGIAAVRFLDDDRLVCEDTTAPYSCGYQARDEDVGRNTLTLVAVDGAGQTASTQRAVAVSRFTPVLSLGVDPRRDRSGPYRFTARGRLVRPASANGACSGTVTVTVRAGKRTVSTRRLRLSKRCTYSVDVRYGRSYGRLRFSARFGGNAVFTPRNSPARAVRTG
jgi:Ca2+-binding RTX toxin-like protein